METTQYQQMLLPYAYNVLGSLDDALDVVQEAMAAHLRMVGEGHIKNTKAYLIKSVVNLAINAKKNRKRTLRPGEVWLPEPIATDDAADGPLLLKDVLSYSLLVLMERLDATERAVFILRESFDYSHEDVAGVLGITQEYSRQLLSRAKKALFKPPASATKAQAAHQRHVVEKFVSAIRARDMQHLEQLMTEDIRFYADGGGKAPMAAGTCIGAKNVAELQISIYERFLTKAVLAITTINHQPAVLSFVKGRLTACQVFEVHPTTQTVLQVNAVLDPKKLKLLAAQQAQNKN